MVKICVYFIPVLIKRFFVTELISNFLVNPSSKSLYQFWETQILWNKEFMNLRNEDSIWIYNMVLIWETSLLQISFIDDVLILERRIVKGGV